MTDGVLETEIKLRVTGPDDATALLSRHGFAPIRERVFEANSVYDLPDGSLRAKGELLRLRLAGGAAVLTWKGPAIPGKHKSRPETEVGVANFDLCARLLRDLGYVLTFRYDKYRTEFQASAGAGTVTLDETPIGTFLELEGPSEWIDEVAALLGFSAADYITESYGLLFFPLLRVLGDCARVHAISRVTV